MTFPPMSFYLSTRRRPVALRAFASFGRSKVPSSAQRTSSSQLAFATACGCWRHIFEGENAHVALDERIGWLAGAVGSYEHSVIRGDSLARGPDIPGWNIRDE